MTAFNLREYVAAQPEEGPEAQLSDRARAMLDAITSADAIEAQTRCDYLVKGWFDRGAVSIVYGPSNVGKTFFALDVCQHVATGAPWAGARVNGGAVLYLAAEGGKGIRNRIAALDGDRAHAFNLLSLPVDFAGEHDATALCAALRAMPEPQRPALIVIDTLAQATAGADENSAADMTRFLRNVDAIRSATGAHIMIVHHSGKDAARGARGHSSLRAAVDTEIELTREGDVSQATATKQRDGMTGGVFAYHLRRVELGADQDGDPVTTCRVDPCEPVTKAKRQKPLGGQAKAALQALDDALANFGEKRSFADFGGVTFHAVMLDHWREATRRRIAADTGDCDKGNAAFRQAWSRVQKTLQDAEYIQVSDDYVMRVPPQRDAVTRRDMGVTCHAPQAGGSVTLRDTPPIGVSRHVTPHDAESLEGEIDL